MKNIISYDQVKKAFKDRGYELLTTREDYKNTTTKVRYKCLKHSDKELWISYHKLNSGKNGCSYCGRIASENSRRTPYKKIKEAFEAKGYTLLSAAYKNSTSLLEYKCNKHPHKVRTITWGNLNQYNKGCRDCANERKAERRRKEMYPIVKEAFESRGLILLEDFYIDAKTKMRFICTVHGEGSMTFDSVKRHGCKKCSTENIIDKQRLTIEQVRIRCLEKGFELLDNVYLNAHQKLKFRCIKHSEVVYGTANCILYKSGGVCQKCGNEKISEKQKRNFREGKVNNSFDKNPNFKGGTTDINRFLRDKDRFWRQENFEKYDYTCFISGVKGGKLHVHHAIPFHQIRDKVFEEIHLQIRDKIGDYEPSEIESIGRRYLEYLKEVDGFPMTTELHKLFHELYGKKNNTTAQVHEFKKRYINREFPFKC